MKGIRLLIQYIDFFVKYNFVFYNHRTKSPFILICVGMGLSANNIVNRCWVVQIDKREKRKVIKIVSQR